MVASSRVYVKIHHPSDVVAGAAARHRARRASPAGCGRSPVEGPGDGLTPAAGECPAPGGAFDQAMTDFSVTWDYRCPFARNAHEHVRRRACAAGADWNVRFVPFSLGQVHVAEGEPDVWERPESTTRGLLALQVGVVVRDRYPDRFLDVHEALFALRHDQRPRTSRTRPRSAGVLAEHGVDADAVFAEIATGAPLETVREEHTAAADDNDVWGVPTFVQGDRAVFVRLMERPRGDGAARHAARSSGSSTCSTGFPELNEFKHTSLKR